MIKLFLICLILILIYIIYTKKYKNHEKFTDSQKKIILQVEMNGGISDIRYLLTVYSDASYEIINLRRKKNIVMIGNLDETMINCVKNIIQHKNKLPIQFKTHNIVMDSIEYVINIDGQKINIGSNIANLLQVASVNDSDDVIRLTRFMDNLIFKRKP